jgi:hypothetical protein
LVKRRETIEEEEEEEEELGDCYFFSVFWKRKKNLNRTSMMHE